MGKKIDIPEKAVEEMARIGATNSEIAIAYSCNESTIRKRFAEILERGRADRRIKLRRKQYDVAVKSGNVQMLIWLGKQDLGQSDKQSSDVRQTIVLRDETVDRDAGEPGGNPIPDAARGAIEDPPGGEAV